MRVIIPLLLMMLATLSPARAAEPNFVIVDPPKALPDVRFVGGDGHTRRLSTFGGKFLVLNIWATWCVPCRKEMPTLDRLQSTLGGLGFEVVALSVDRGGLDVVRKFYGKIGVSHLATYADTSGKALRDLAIAGLPTTLLIDREGREIGRLVGPAEWDAPDTIAFLQRLIGRRTGALVPPAGIPPAAFCEIKGSRSISILHREFCA